MSGLFISASGILNVIRRQDVTANNIANSATTGFQASRADSVDVASGGVTVGSTTRNTNLGSVLSTGIGTDLSTARGFFQVERADGSTAFTLDGRFGLNANGEVVTADGLRVQPPIQAPPGSNVAVTSDGTVFATSPGTTEPVEIGRLEIVQFPNPEGLESLGGNLLAATSASGTSIPVPTPNVRSGTLQSSNVNLATELVNVIGNRNALQANIAAFRAQSDVIGELFDQRQ